MRRFSRGCPREILWTSQVQILSQILGSWNATLQLLIPRLSLMSIMMNIHTRIKPLIDRETLFDYWHWRWYPETGCLDEQSLSTCSNALMTLCSQDPSTNFESCLKSKLSELLVYLFYDLIFNATDLCFWPIN